MEQMAITDQELAALRRLAETPAEYASGEHAAAQSQLASAVPALLDEIQRLRDELEEVEAEAKAGGVG
jgi:hypothetical protein